MKVDIDSLSEKELIGLNHRIVERLKFLESMRTHAEMLTFSVGERVSFMSSQHEKMIGILVKYNRKTVTVITENGQKWNVSPQLLEKHKGEKEEGLGGDHVIKISQKNAF